MCFVNCGKDGNHNGKLEFLKTELQNYGAGNYAVRWIFENGTTKLWV